MGASALMAWVELGAIVVAGGAIGWLGRLLRDFVYSGRAIVVDTIVNQILDKIACNPCQVRLMRSPIEKVL